VTREIERVHAANYQVYGHRKVWTQLRREGIAPGASACSPGTDLQGLVFHELRHTAAALAIAHGAHPQTIRNGSGTRRSR
jgi:hypothetical protein